MSSTNKTTNYELSQFIGSDKPAWLSDYNGDMGKIDTGIHNAQTTATGADGKADANTTKIGTLANLTTTAKTDLVSAVNEVNTSAGTAQETATQAGTLANGAKTTADALSRYFTITQNGKITPTVTGGTIGNINDVYYALNADGTFGKVYGRLRVNASATTVTVKFPISPLANPSSAYTIAGGSFFTATSGGTWNSIGGRDITVNTDHSISWTISNLSVGESITIWLPPCCYFFTNFGDQPSPDA